MLKQCYLLVLQSGLLRDIAAHLEYMVREGLLYVIWCFLEKQSAQVLEAETYLKLLFVFTSTGH